MGDCARRSSRPGCSSQNVDSQREDLEIQLHDPARNYLGNVCGHRTNECAGDVRFYDWGASTEGRGTTGCSEVAAATCSWPRAAAGTGCAAAAGRDAARVDRRDTVRGCEKVTR